MKIGKSLGRGIRSNEIASRKICGVLPRCLPPRSRDCFAMTTASFHGLYVPLGWDFALVWFLRSFGFMRWRLGEHQNVHLNARTVLCCRKVIRAYQDSWDNRCRLLFCCMGNSDRSRVSSAKNLIAIWENSSILD